MSTKKIPTKVVKKASPRATKTAKPKPGTWEAVQAAFAYAKKHKLVYG